MRQVTHGSRIPQLRDAEWLSAALADRGLQDIADELGCSVATVANARIHLGVPSPRIPGQTTGNTSHNGLAWEDFAGKRFGMLTVESLIETPKGAPRAVYAACDCGGGKIVTLSTLNTKRPGWDHCGCQTPRRASTARALRCNGGKCLVATCPMPAEEGSDRCAEHVGLSRCPVVEVGEAEPCGGFVASKGLCNKHIKRFRSYGDPTVVEKGRPPRERRVAVTTDGYRSVTVDGRSVKEHRWVMEQTLGRKLLPHENVHHINGDRSDNRPENLELWSTKQPPGQRVEDKVRWAREILSSYGEMFPET